VTSTQQLLHTAPRPDPAAGSPPPRRAQTPHEHRRDCTSTRTIHPVDTNKERSERRSARNWPIAALACFCIPLLTGCTGAPQTTQFSSTSSDSTLGVEADWNDIDAAVAVAVGRVEMAVVSANPRRSPFPEADGATSRTFELKTVRDEPAWLLITRGDTTPGADPRHRAMMDALDTAPAPSTPPAPEMLVMRARVGRFGHAERELALLRAVAHRLEQLKGVETFPVD
jgi:hypothetical protein